MPLYLVEFDRRRPTGNCIRKHVEAPNKAEAVVKARQEAADDRQISPRSLVLISATRRKEQG